MAEKIITPTSNHRFKIENYSYWHKVIVSCTFDYTGKPIKKYFLIKKLPDKNDEYYLTTAKNRFIQQEKKGSIERYSKRFLTKKTNINIMPNPGKHRPLIMSIIFGVVAAGCLTGMIVAVAQNSSHVVDIKYTVSIDANGGYLPKVSGETSDPQSRNIETNSIPYSPVAYNDLTYHDKYELEGWYDAKVGGNKISFPYEVVKNTTIYAHWNRARFSAVVYGNEKGCGEKDREIEKWPNIAMCLYDKKPTPQKGDINLEGKTGSAAEISNYTLKNWDIYEEGSYDKPKYTQENVNLSPLTFNAVIYPNYEQSKYNITLHKGTLTSTVTGVSKGKIDSPAVPKNWLNEHSVFKGWYSDKDCKTLIDFETFDLNGDTDFYFDGGELAMGKVYLHTSFDKISTTYNGTEDYYYDANHSTLGPGFLGRSLPDVEHYYKVGWAYTDTAFDDKTWTDPKDSKIVYSKPGESEYGTVIEFPSDGVRPSAGDRIAHLYPKYEQAQFKITFDAGELATSVPEEWTQDKDKTTGQAIPSSTSMPVSTKSFYKFLGWNDNGVHITNDTEWCNHTFSKDTKLTALWEQESYKASFNVLVGSATYDNYSFAIDQQGLTQLTEGALSDISKAIQDQPSFRRDNAEIAGWTTTKPESLADTFDLSKIMKTITLTKDTNLYAIYYNNEINLTINLGGASISGQTSDVTIKTSTKVVNDMGEWYHQLEDQKGKITPPEIKPNFYGWKKTSGELITFPTSLTEDTTIEMVWADSTKFLVTFDAGQGEFWYQSGGVTKTAPIISYQVDLSDEEWTDPENRTVENIYKAARDKVGCLDDNYLTRDGYTYGGLSYNGVPVSDKQILSDTTGLEVIWNKNTASDWWTDDVGILIASAEDESTTGFIHAGVSTKLEDDYYEAWHGTKVSADDKDTRTKDADTFVGLEKKIRIPSLDPNLYYNTRVIGEKQDIDKDGKRVYLTVQFVDIPISTGYAPEYDRDARYNNSIITKSTLPYLLNIMPTSLTSHFKSVQKPYLTDTNKQTSEDLKTLDASLYQSLFVLSASEYGGDFSNNSKSAFLEKSLASEAVANVFAYKYYDGKGDGSASQEVLNRAGTAPNNSPTTISTTLGNVWTRTPVTTNCHPKHSTDFDVLFIGCNSSNINIGAMCSWDPMSGFGICPAFCIGQLFN